MRVVQRRGERAARADVQDPRRRPARRAGDGAPPEVVPADQGPRHRRLAELRGEQARSRRSRPPPTTARPGGSSSRTSIACTSSASASSASCARTSATSSAATNTPTGSTDRVSSCASRRWRCIRRTCSTGATQTREEGGLGFCNITKCCTEVCPEHIHITDNAIIPLKERVADVRWDPVRFVGRKLFGRNGD